MNLNLNGYANRSRLNESRVLPFCQVLFDRRME